MEPEPGGSPSAPLRTSPAAAAAAAAGGDGRERASGRLAASCAPAGVEGGAAEAGLGRPAGEGEGRVREHEVG